jgi:ABC-type enterobactin transport system permease subunit
MAQGGGVVSPRHYLALIALFTITAVTAAVGPVAIVALLTVGGVVLVVDVYRNRKTRS